MRAATVRWALLPSMVLAVALAQGCNNNPPSAPGAAPRVAQSTTQTSGSSARPGAAQLQTWLQGVAADPTMNKARLATLLQASAATWEATIIAPFTECRAASEQALTDAISTLWPALRTTPPSKITVRKHYAGDVGLPPGAAHLRWALPVLFDSYVVALDDKTIDLVFWADRHGTSWHWLAIGNIDAALALAITQGQGSTATSFSHCAQLVVASQHNERCLQLAAAVVLAALHNDRNATTHACALADVHCTEGR